MDETIPPPESGTSASWVDALASPPHPSASEPELTGQVFAHRYEVGERLGQGGFGVVYRGRDTLLDTDVALKFLRVDRIAPPQREAFVQRFIEEAQVAAQLRHPGVVTVLDVALARVGESSRPFIVAELLEGRTLRAWSRDTPSLGQWLKVMIALGEALTFAHAHKVFHRDIKPENVLVLPDGRPKLLDFGLAQSSEHVDRALDIPRPRLDLRAAGTPGYMPPEQLAGEAQTAATDVFAWGVLMHESLSGGLPRASPTGPIVPVDETRGDLPRDLVALIHRCVALEASARPVSAREVTDALIATHRLLPPGSDTPAHLTVAPDAQPYPGLQPFGAAQADEFFGREALVRTLVARLSGGAKWLSLEAPSGRGKSSFVRAGLLPRLVSRGLPAPGARLIELRPGTSLTAALIAHATAPADPAHATTVEAPPAAPPPPSQPLDPIAALLAPADPLVVVVDPLEELASQPASEEARMLALIRALLARTDAPTLLITVVRSDLLDRLETVALETSHALRVHLPPLDDPALREAITSPAMRAGVHVEPALADALMHDVAGATGALPLLAETLRALWQRRSGGALTLADYRALGGLGAAARTWGDTLLAACPDRERLRAALLAAVAHDGARPRGRALSRGEVRAAAGEDAVGRATLALLLGRSGLRPLWIEDESGDVSWIHESVIGAWPTLAGWVADAQRALVARTELEAAAAAWARDGRPRDALLRGEQLAYFGAASSPSARAAELLEVSRRADRQRARRTRGALATLAVVAVAVAVVMALLQQRAEQQRRSAVTALADAEAAAAAQHLAQGDRVRARAAVRASLESADTVAARALWWRLLEDDVALYATLPTNYGNLDFQAPGLAIANWDGALLVDPDTGALRRLPRSGLSSLWGRFTPDARTFAMTSGDGRRTMWQPHGDRVIEHPAEGSRVQAQALSPDGQWLVTGHKSGRVMLSAVGSTTAFAITTLATSVSGTSFSLDGREVALIDSAGRIEVFDVATREVRRLVDTRHPVWSQAWKRTLLHAAGDRLFVNHSDHHARVYDAKTGALIRLLDGDAEEQGCMDVTPDGETVAIPGRDGRVHVWRARDVELLTVLEAHAREAVCVQFWGDGQRLISTGLERTAALWDMTTYELLFRTPVMSSHVQRAPLSPDGHSMAMVVGDKLWMWRVDHATQERPGSGHAGPESYASLIATPEGLRIASTSSERDLRLWDPQTGREVAVVTDVGLSLGTPAFTRDGKRFALTVGDQLQIRSATTAALWSLAVTGSARGGTPIAWAPDGERLVYTGSYSEPVLVEGQRARTLTTTAAEDPYTVAWSPDGRWLAAGGYARVLFLYEQGRSDRPSVYPFDDVISGLHFHPRDAWLAVGTRDGRVYRVAPATGRRTLLHSAAGRGGPLAISADGRRMFLGVGGTLRIVDLRTGDFSELSGHRGVIHTVAVDDQGKWAVTGGEDGTVRLWDLVRGRPAWRWVLASSQPAEVLTVGGWQRFDGEPVQTGEAAWRARAIEANRGDRRGDRVCLAVDDHLEVWTAASDRQVARARVPSGVRWVVADPGGCSVGGPAGLVRVDVRGERTVLEAAPLTAMGAGVDTLAWATSSTVVVASARGVARSRTLVEGVVTAISADASGVSMGTRTGLVIWEPTEGDRQIIENGPVSPITSVRRTPGGLLAVGYQRGDLLLWSAAGVRLHASHLHGMVESLETDGRYLYATSELGSTQVWDLDTFVRDRCALLREVWPQAGVWKDGRMVNAPPPPDHPCLILTP